MSDDWKPGDLALCVRSGTSIRAGFVGVVTRVEVTPIGTGLWLSGICSDALTGGYHAWRFRKIRPHTPDEEDAETIRLLTGKPVRAPKEGTPA